MSVVVWDGTTLAGDRFAQHGDMKYQRVKVFQLGPFIWAGFVGTINGWWIAKEFLEGKISKPDHKVSDFSALVIRKRGTTIEVTTMDEDFVEIPITTDKYALGAGREFALGAMWYGASAVSAVDAACAICASCDGPIDSFVIGDLDELPF